MKRIISAVLCVLTVLTVSLTACGSKTKAAPTLSKPDHVFRGVDFTLPEDYNGYSTIFYSTADSRVYFLTQEIVDKENYRTRPVLYSVDSSGGEPRVDALTETSEGGDYISVGAYTQLPSGDAFISRSYNADTAKQTNILTIRGESGDTVFEGDISELFEASRDKSYYGGGYDSDQSVYISSMTCDKAGNIYVSTDYSVLILSGEGKKLSEYSSGGYIQSISGGTDAERVMVNGQDYNSGSPIASYLDPKTGSASGEVSLPDTLKLNYNITIYPGPGFDIYYNDGSSLYGYNSGGEAVELCDWVNSDISADYFNNFVIIDADHFLYTWYDNDGGAQKCSIMTRVPDEELTEKYVIKLACQYSYGIKSAVVAFNRQSDKYRIEIEDYSKYMGSDENSYENMLSKFDSDILGGNPPDIIISSTGSLDIRKYASKGLLCDLYEYIDADTELNRESFVSCALVPFETDGKLYTLPNGFNIQTYAVLTDTVGSLKSWTPTQMLEIWKNQPEGTEFTDYASRDTILSMFISSSLEDYVDYSAGSCNFDTEDFRSLLEFSASFPVRDDYDQDYYENLEDDRFRTGKTFLNNVYLSSFTDYLRYTDGAYRGLDVTFIGYPTTTDSGSKIGAQVQLSIMKASPVADGAWEFVRHMVTSVGKDMYYFPSTVAGIKALAEEEKKNYYVFSADGSGYSSSQDPIDENTDWVKSEGGHVSRLTDEDVEKILAFLNGVTSAPSYDTKIMQMITEEASYYFSGQKSLDDTVKVIQSRVSLYISENY